MPLSQKAIDELKQIYKEEFNEDLPDQEAWEMAHQLLNFFSIILRPLPNEVNQEQKEESLPILDAGGIWDKIKKV